VLDSDGTLILTRGCPAGGTALTIQIARAKGKPCFIADLDRPPKPAEVRNWFLTHQIRVLNVAGPRESESPGIYEQAAGFLRAVLA
jgi:hypothetical protein